MLRKALTDIYDLASEGDPLDAHTVAMLAKTALEHKTIQLKKYDFDGEKLTVPEAMEKFGLTKYQVQARVRRKRTDKPTVVYKRGPKPMPVRSRGVTYECALDCAKHNNVGVDAVYIAVNEGKIDHIGKNSNPNYEQEMEDYKAMQVKERQDRLKPNWMKRQESCND